MTKLNRVQPVLKNGKMSRRTFAEANIYMRDFARSRFQYKYIWQNPQWQYGFMPLMQEFWAERPDGMPQTWTHVDIDTDLGTFSEDTYPPALPGETLEEYCRRVPNVWSPCSKSTDTVDVAIFQQLEWAQDVHLEDHKFTERPMIKISPADSDYRLEQDWLDLEERGTKQPPLVHGKPLYPVFTKEEIQQTIAILEEGMLRVGAGYNFKAKNWPDFWQEITGQDEVPEGDFYNKLRNVFYPDPNNFELPDELREPWELATKGSITDRPNRWAQKQEELLREEADFNYVLDQDLWKSYRERMDRKIDGSGEFGDTHIRDSELSYWNPENPQKATMENVNPK